jgi:hypothetical protein
VVDIARAIERRPFQDVEIAEIMLRLYKTTPERVRPLDRMTAHTGYLVFARKVVRRLADVADGDESGEAATSDDEKLNDDTPPATNDHVTLMMDDPELDVTFED